MMNAIRTGAAGLRRHPMFFVGLDLGKAQNHTALSVIERREMVYYDRDPVTQAFRTELTMRIRHLQRIPLDTPYPDIVEFVRRVVSRPELGSGSGGRRTSLVVDASGVGAPVVDLLRKAQLPCLLAPVTITSGDRETSDALGYGVPKRDLIVGLQVAFENRWLRVSRGAAHAEEFVKELLDMRLFMSRFGGYERYEGGVQDDLVLATALAWWKLRRSWPEMPASGSGHVC